MQTSHNLLDVLFHITSSHRRCRSSLSQRHLPYKNYPYSQKNQASDHQEPFRKEIRSGASLPHSPPAQPSHHPSISLRRPPTLPGRLIHRQNLPSLGQLNPRSLALLRLAIHRLRHRRRPTHVCQQKHLHHKLPAIVLHLQPIAHPNIPCRLRHILIRLNPPQLTSLRRQWPSLEKSCSPKPLIHPNRSHAHILIQPSPSAQTQTRCVQKKRKKALIIYKESGKFLGKSERIHISHVDSSVTSLPTPPQPSQLL